MAAKSIQEFTAELRERNIARPNLYHVSLGVPPKMLVGSEFNDNRFAAAGTTANAAVSLASMWCASAATPDIQMFTNDNYVENGIKRKFAYDYDFTDLSLTFYIDQGYEIKKFFDDWMKIIVPYQRRFNYPDDYTAESLFLTITNQNDKDTYQYEFKRVFPKTIMPIDLNYSSGTTISTFAVNFVYEDYSYTKFNAETGSKEYSSDAFAGPQQPVGTGTAVDAFTEVALPNYVTNSFSTFPAVSSSVISGMLPNVVGSFMRTSLPTLLSSALTGNLSSTLTTLLGSNVSQALNSIIATNLPAFNSLIMANLPPLETIIAANLPAYGNSVTNIPRLLADKMPAMIASVVAAKMPQIVSLVSDNLP